MSRAVNGTPLTPGSGLLAGGGGTRSVSLSRYEPPLRVEDLGVVHTPVDHGGGGPLA
jgi:hypothetical protein